MTLLKRWSDWPLRTKAFATFSLPLIPFAVFGSLVLVVAQRERTAQAEVSHTLEVKTQIATTLGLIFDAEVGIRGFLLAGQRESLETHNAAANQIPAALERLRRLTSDNPPQVARVRDVAAEYSQQPLARFVGSRTSNAAPLSVPLDLVVRSRGHLARIRRILAEMQETEDRLLTQRAEAAQAAWSLLVSTTIAGAVLSVVGSLLGAMLFTTSVTRRIDGTRANADRLLRREPLVPSPPAADELGYLDRRLENVWGVLNERIQAAEDAREDIDQFFSVSLDMLCIADCEGRFLRVNPAWTAALGWSAEELTAVPYVTFTHPDDVAPTVAATAQLAQGDSVVNFENRYRCKDGSYRWLNWQAAALPARGLVIAAARDVSEQKRAAMTLRRQVDETAAINQELDAFTYSVSHDLRAPLRHIAGFATLLAKSAAHRLEESDRGYLTRISEAAARMSQLIDELLAFSRNSRSALVTQTVSLSSLVDDVRREMAPATEGRAITWNVQPLPDVHADPGMLRLVLVNLISNAVKYSGARPQAVIDIGATLTNDDELVVSVRDNGAGFDMKYAHKLFGVFQRLHRQDEFEGTGIGLANVRRIVQRHGGRTWAEGSVDGGATFYFSLPRR